MLAGSLRQTCFRLLGAALVAHAAFAANAVSTLKSGKADLKSAGAMTFGPDAVLFVGDPLGASIYAFDTEDRTPAKGAEAISIQGANEKIAALLGTTPDQILINDLAVNPISKRIYLSVSRGRGPEAAPVILRVDAGGKFQEFELANVKHSKVVLPNAPADGKDARGQNKRLEAITDLAYLDGRLFVAGLSNEEFASNLRAIPFPFQNVEMGTSVEIYHGSHGRFETNSPVRTFVPYSIDGKPYLLAAYTCTPLVKLAISDLKAGSKVMGKTIAELGNRNRPLDMVVYRRDGKDYILMNNSSRGVMKLPTANLDSYPAITKQTETTGVPYETIASLKGVEQLDLYNQGNALMLIRNEGGSLDLKTVALP